MYQVYAFIEFLSAMLPVALLAVVLCVAGYQTRKMLSARAASRADRAVQSAAALAAARAAARAKARAAF